MVEVGFPSSKPNELVTINNCNSLPTLPAINSPFASLLPACIPPGRFAACPFRDTAGKGLR